MTILLALPILTPAASSVLDLGVRSGDLAGLTGATVAVDADAARLRKVSVGGTVSLVLGDGAPVEARVVGWRWPADTGKRHN